jgi:hypothetical protein
VRGLVVALVLLAMVAPGSAPGRDSKGLANHRNDGQIDVACSYRATSDQPTTCSRSIVRVGVWGDPTPGEHTVWWPYVGAAFALLSATALGLRRARASTAV